MAELPEVEIIYTQIENLKTQLQSQLPNYDQTLREIHTRLKTMPDVVALLSPEQVGVISAGLQKKTAMYFAEAASKSKSSGDKRNIGVEDL